MRHPERISARAVIPTEIAAVRALLVDLMPVSGHVAARIEAWEWDPEAITERVVGLWAEHARAEGAPVAAGLEGVLVRGSSTMAVARSPVLSAVCRTHPDLLEGATSFTAPVASFQEDVPGDLIEIWSGPATAQRGGRPVRVPATRELPAFACASIAAFEEELGRPPVAAPFDPDYLALWQRRREEGRILGVFDETGRCEFRVEVRPLLGVAVEIVGVWLAPHLRGRGWGTHYLEATMAVIGERWAATALVHVESTNGPARAAYARVGMQQVGRLVRLDLTGAAS